MQKIETRRRFDEKGRPIRRIMKGFAYGRHLKRTKIEPNGKQMVFHATKGWRVDPDARSS